MFRKKDASPQGTAQTQEVPPKPAGSIVVFPKLQPPAREVIKPLKQVAGENPTFYNLRDNDFLDGEELVFVAVKLHAGTIADSRGEIRDFITALAWLDLDKQPRLIGIITGAENVVGRLLMVEDQINQGQPFSAKLRKAGRSWQLD